MNLRVDAPASNAAKAQLGRVQRPAHIVMTVNKAWNIWNFRRNLVSALLNAGAKVTVVAARDAYANKLEELGCAFVDLDIDSKGLNPFREWHLYRGMREIFTHLQPDAILSYTVKNNIYGSIAATGLGVPIIPNVTGLGTAFLSGSLLRAAVECLYCFAFRNAPTVFFQNEDDLELFVRRRLVKLDQAVLIPGSGIDLEHFTWTPMPSRQAGTVFLMIARLLRDKGVLEYVEAAQKISVQFPGTRFRLLGPECPDNRSAVTLSEVRAADRNHCVEYLGALPDVRDAIVAAHCVVLPSYREGAPRVLIEAAAMGRPLIATDVPGCRAVVSEGDNGYLCSAKDAGHLAARMIEFLKLSAAAQAQMGKRARERTERELSVNRVIGAYWAALKNIGLALGGTRDSTPSRPN